LDRHARHIGRKSEKVRFWGKRAKEDNDYGRAVRVAVSAVDGMEAGEVRLRFCWA
jgi:hypothetical protein